MTNQMFDQGREGYLRGEISWNVAVIKVALVRGYTINHAHKFVSDITGAGGTIHATSSALTSKTTTAGVADAADFTYPAVTTNANNHYLLVYQASAVTGGSDVAASAQRIICYLDSGTNLPIVPNGGDANIVWPNDATKIFKL